MKHSIWTYLIQKSLNQRNWKSKPGEQATVTVMVWRGWHQQHTLHSPKAHLDKDKILTAFGRRGCSGYRGVLRASLAKLVATELTTSLKWWLLCQRAVLGGVQTRTGSFSHRAVAHSDTSDFGSACIPLLVASAGSEHSTHLGWEKPKKVPQGTCGVLHSGRKTSSASTGWGWPARGQLCWEGQQSFGGWQVGHEPKS